MSAQKPSRDFLQDATFLVDSSSYIFRAYYAIRTNLKAPDGTPTHATFGFVQMLLSLYETYKPQSCVMVWDHKSRGYRQDIFADYKANRSAPPDDLGVQITNTKEAVEILGFHQLECPGFEADDILATLVRKNPERNFVVVTADKDLLQLVGPRVWCLDTGKNQWSNEFEAREKFGVAPAQISEVQALSGDPVDNIKGAPGIGPKTATELILYYGSLENLLGEAWELSQNLKPLPKDSPLKGKRLEAIAGNLDVIRVSHKLVTLNEDVPIKTHFEDFAIKKPDMSRLQAFATKLGFAKIVERSSSLFESSEAAPSVAPPATPLDWTFKLIGSSAELKEILAAHAQAPQFALDSETFGLDRQRKNNMVGFSFSFDGHTGYYVPLRHKEGSNLEAAEALKILFDDLKHRPDNFKVIFQNAKFDLHIFLKEEFTLPPHLRIDDTMVASFVIDPTEAHGMDDLSVKYLAGYRPLSFATLLGDLTDFSEVKIADAAFYAAEDAVVTYRIWEVLQKKLHEENLWPVYDLIDRPLIPVLFEMERVGVAVDQEYLFDLSRQLKSELATREESARQSLRDSGLEIAPDLNLASPKQLAQILYEKLNLPILKKGKTGPSTDASVLAELALSHPFPAELLEIRELSKLLSTYVEALPTLVNAESRRLHTDFSQTVAVTGRLSSSNPNLQNIPIRTERGKKIRGAFRADPGYRLVGIDYSQIELRILAYITQDKELVRAFREKADIHRRTAALVLGKAENEVTDEDRRMAKAINFGIIYGQSAYGLSRALKIPKAQAQKFIDDYFKTYPGIKTYMSQAIQEARETGYVRTLTGRRRAMPEIHSKNGALRQFAERTAINSPVQGTAADLMKAAMITTGLEVQKKFPQARMVLQVHDELLFEVPEGDAADLQALIQKTLEDPAVLRSFKIEDFSLVTQAEASSGTHWGEL